MRDSAGRRGALSLAALPPQIEVLLDGPYGAPSQHVFETRHGILVAAGIGVTPSASILSSVLARWLAKHKPSLPVEGGSGGGGCPAGYGKQGRAAPPHGSLGVLERLDFIWLSNDRLCFTWFHELMLECERELGPPFFKLHIFLTYVLELLQAATAR